MVDAMPPVEQAARTADAARAVLAELPAPGHRPPPWVLVFDDQRTGVTRVAESLLTTADGIVGTRGSLEEDGATAEPAVFVAGLYEPAEGVKERLVQLPPWTLLSLRLPLTPGLRLLDMRTGVVWRAVERGGQTVFTSAHWACLERPGTEVLVAAGPQDVLLAEQGPSLRSLEYQIDEHHRVEVVTRTETALEVRDGDDTRRMVARIARYEPVVGEGPRRPAAGPMEIDQLFAEQERAWAARWRAADVEVVGDEALTLAVRLGLFHITSSVGHAAEAAVGARGLSGAAYAGHVFWDADVFVLPVLASTLPLAARAMLEYRLQRLQEARNAARRAGREGARFPWESAATGEDVTPTSGLNERGESVAIRTGALEEHITAGVAWAAWQYAAATGDWRYLEGRGRSLLVETARYWASRVRIDGDGNGHIDGVIGPDEYHEDVDDNAYTNIMAAWNLRRATEVAERCAAGIAAGEPARWRTVADSILDGYDPGTGRHQQFNGYDDLEPVLATDFGTGPVPAAVLLGQPRLAGSQIIKQADVLMAHHLVPDAMVPGSLPRDLAHYLPRTAHGSSLSPAIHAAVLARAGQMEQAVRMLEIARRIDVEDMTGTAAGGVHLAAMGGLWQALVFGFAGIRPLRPDDPALVVDPSIPEGWDELRVALTWHGTSLVVRCRPDVVHVAPKGPVPVSVRGGPPVLVDASGAWMALGGARTEEVAG